MIQQNFTNYRRRLSFWGEKNNKKPGNGEVALSRHDAICYIAPLTTTN